MALERAHQKPLADASHELPGEAAGPSVAAATRGTVTQQADARAAMLVAAGASRPVRLESGVHVRGLDNMIARMHARNAAAKAATEPLPSCANSSEAVNRGPGKGPTLRLHDYGERVRQVQERLRQDGVKIEVDGIYGGPTEQAVKEFQKKRGIGVDGIVGPVTAKEMAKVAARSASSSAAAASSPAAANAPTESIATKGTNAAPPFMVLPASVPYNERLVQAAESQTARLKHFHDHKMPVPSEDTARANKLIEMFEKYEKDYGASPAEGMTGHYFVQSSLENELRR